jgi:O-antigen/teichoic acid export membrane protein
VKTSLLKNGFYNTAGGVLRIGLGIITIPLLIRQLGVEEYGLWTLASAVIGVVTLAEAGLSTATTVFVAQDLGEEDLDGLSQTLTVTVTMMLVMATLAAVGLWFGADLVTDLFPQLQPLQRVEVSRAFQVGAVAVWARLVQQVLVGVEQAYQRYDLVNLIGTMQSLLTSIGMLLIVWWGGRTLELMEWQALASILILASHIWVVRSLLRNTSIRVAWVKEKASEVGKYSSMVWLSSLGGVLFSRVDRLIVGNILGTHVLGVYAAITDITSQINGLSALPVQPLVPLLGQFSKDDYNQLENLKKQIKKAVEINTFVALGLGGSLVALAPFLLKIILPNELNIEYVAIFQIATMIYSLYSLNAVGYYILFGIKAVTAAASIQLTVGLGSLFLIAFGSYHFGLVGAVMGNSFYLFVYGLTFISMRHLNISNILWIKWIWLPTSCFIIFSLGSLLIPFSPIVNLTIFGLQISVIIGWLLSRNKAKKLQA